MTNSVFDCISTVEGLEQLDYHHMTDHENIR